MESIHRKWLRLLAFTAIFILFIILSASGDTCRQKVIVRNGDTLAKICRAHYGKFDPTTLKNVLKQNPGLTNPNRIQVGDVICLDDSDISHRTPPTGKIRMTPRSEPSVAYTRPTPSDDKKPDIRSEPPHPPSTERAVYPPAMPGAITRLTWLDDNNALVEGRMDADINAVFYVFVPGDLEYEQTDIVKPTSHTFQVKAIIGRQGRDYGQSFMLKLALFTADNQRFAEITRPFVRKEHAAGESVDFGDSASSAAAKPPTGWPGLETWMAVQEMDSLKSDNRAFKVPNGRLVINYRYMGFNPDEPYLSRYGRITLYGSSCLAKALLLKGEAEKAEQILRPWAAQVMEDGKVPRSANVVGDNYISPDIRTGEVAHFFGVLALARLTTHNTEWDEPIRRILVGYLLPLIDPETGLVKGGYNGVGGNGYGRPYSYEKIEWCSTEHNLDLFQSLILAAQTYRGLGLDITCDNLAWDIGKSIDKYLWDENAGTFNQGWRPEGPDRSRALDCASWGALYLIKQARLAKESRQSANADLYLSRARRCLDYADTHFQTAWYYRTPSGKEGRIRGYRPYYGQIPDVLYEDGPLAGRVIDWSSLNDIVWSEGTLGVAKAWEELARQTGDATAQKRMQEIYQEMIALQSLSDKGGILYSTKQIKGHFTMGEELASIGWLGYLSALNDFAAPRQNKEMLKWIAW